MNVPLCGIRVLKMQAIGPLLWVNMIPQAWAQQLRPRASAIGQSLLVLLNQLDLGVP